MSYVSVSPSSVTITLFVIYSEIWALWILAESENGERFIAFLEKEMVEDWELLC